MNLSISNIAWVPEQDTNVYRMMKNYGYSGLEIAPTRIFPENPYGDLDKARLWAEVLKEKEGFQIPSMQSIWYGRTEIFLSLCLLEQFQWSLLNLLSLGLLSSLSFCDSLFIDFIISII